MNDTTGIESLLHSFQPAIIVIVTVLLMRLILNKIFNSLAERGTLTITTKVTIMRFIDIIVFFTIVIAFLQVVIAPYQVLVAVSIIVVLSLFLFFYELREFMAYINLQLLRHLRGKTFEILLPYHIKPIYGRIASIDLLSSTIEDIYGRRIHVSNSLLMNAILREHIPSIMLRITLKSNINDVSELLNNIVKSLKEIDIRLFRIDERKISIEEISNNEFIFKLIVYPTVTPVRISDIANLINRLITLMRSYNPEIKVIELT